MPSLYKTATGRVIDMEALRLANETSVAVGNANLNARGDLLGPGGKIVKTREELAKEYYRKNPKAVKHEELKADEVVPAAVGANETPVVKQVDEDPYVDLKPAAKKSEKKKQ